MVIEGLYDLCEPFFSVESFKDMPGVIVPHSIECFLEVDDIVGQVPLVLQVFLDEDPTAEDL